jgi:hypothetical protein
MRMNCDTVINPSMIGGPLPMSKNIQVDDNRLTIDDVTWADLKAGPANDLSTVGAAITAVLGRGGKVIIDDREAGIKRSYDSLGEFKRDVVDINARREELGLPPADI